MTATARVSRASEWIVCPRPAPAAHVRLVCFPFAGGGAASYAGWQHAMPPEVEIWAVRLPGRETRRHEDPRRRLVPLAEELAAALAPELAAAPYAFFGHSLGALLAFETARALRSLHAREPISLLLSGRRAPDVPPTDAPLHQLPDAEFVHALQLRYGGIPEVVLGNHDLLGLFIPILRADCEMLETYVFSAGQPLAAHIRVLGGDADERASLAALLAWRAQTTGSFSCRVFAGGHFFVQTAQSDVLTFVTGELTALLGDVGRAPQDR